MRKRLATLARSLRPRFANLPPLWLFGLIAGALLGLTGLFVVFSRVDPLQIGFRTGLLVGATIGFLLALAGLPTGLLAAVLLRFGVGRHVISESMAQAARLGIRVLLFSIAVLAGLLFAGGSDPVSFPWLVVGLALGMSIGMLGLLSLGFSLAAVLGMVLGLPLALLLDRSVGEGENRHKPYWAARQRLADRFWQPLGPEAAEPFSPFGSEAVVFIGANPLQTARAMLDFLDHGYQVTFETPATVMNPQRLPGDPRLFVGPRSILTPWLSRPRGRSPAAFGATNVMVALHARYPRARFLVVEEDELATELGTPLLTYHAHASLDDGSQLLTAGRAALGPHAPIKSVRVLDWLERKVLPAAGHLPAAPEIRLMQAGIIRPQEAFAPELPEVRRSGEVLVRDLAVPVYEIASWDAWAEAEKRIRDDGAARALLHGPHDMLDAGWMVYIDGEVRGEVGSLEIACGLLDELIVSGTALL